MERTEPNELLVHELSARLAAIQAVADTIRHLRSVPSGRLYASVMGVLSLDRYEQIVGVLVDAALVERSPNHMLRWIGQVPR